jgi:hypothetical protein
VALPLQTLPDGGGESFVVVDDEDAQRVVGRNGGRGHEDTSNSKLKKEQGKMTE